MTRDGSGKLKGAQAVRDSIAWWEQCKARQISIGNPDSVARCQDSIARSVKLLDELESA